jgi:hypothetical protein
MGQHQNWAALKWAALGPIASARLWLLRNFAELVSMIAGTPVHSVANGCCTSDHPRGH